MALLLEHDMKTQMFDVKTLIIGLLLGVCTMLVVGAARGEAPQKLDADYRYQISAVQEQNGSYTLFILDHETNKVYSRQGFPPNGQGREVKQLIER